MINKVYSGKVRTLSKSAGFHPYFKRVYSNVRPYSFVDVHTRQKLREQAKSIYPFSTREEIEIPWSPADSEIEPPEEFQKVIGSHVLEQPFVAKIEDGRILKQKGFVAADDYTILLDGVSSREKKIRRSFSRRQVAQLVYNQRVNNATPVKKTELEIAVSLIRTPFSPPAGRTIIGSKNYSHWVQCYLTLLEGVQYYEQETGDRPTLLLEPDPPSWMLGSLKHLGYDSTDFYFWQPDEELRVSQLIVPSVRRMEQTVNYNSETQGAQYKIMSPNACRWLQGAAIDRCSNGADDLTYSPKVFVSRADASRRRLQNRDEIMELLRSYGFKSYELSSLKFEQQVELFSQAQEVVSVHGAGLANLIFASDCRVTEIFGGTSKPTYYLLSNILDLEYQFVLGTPVYNPDVRLHHRDIKLSPAELKKVLE